MIPATRPILDTTQDYIVDVLRNYHPELVNTSPHGIGSINSPFFNLRIVLTPEANTVRIITIARSAFLDKGLSINFKIYQDFPLSDPNFYEHIAELLKERHKFLTCDNAD